MQRNEIHITLCVFLSNTFLKCSLVSVPFMVNDHSTLVSRKFLVKHVLETRIFLKYFDIPVTFHSPPFYTCCKAMTFSFLLIASYVINFNQTQLDHFRSRRCNWYLVTDLGYRNWKIASRFEDRDRYRQIIFQTNLPQSRRVWLWNSDQWSRNSNTEGIHRDSPWWARSVPVCTGRRTRRRRSPCTDNPLRNRGMGGSRGNRTDRACNREIGGNRQRTGRTCTPSNPVCNHKRLLPGTRSVFKLANGKKINPDLYISIHIVSCDRWKKPLYL